MSESKKGTYIVVHPKLNMMTNKKLQRLPVGAELTLTAKQAKSLGAKVRSLTAQNKLDMTSSGKDKDKDKDKYKYNDKG